MYKFNASKTAAVAALALTFMSTLPSFAWGFHPRRNEVVGRDRFINRELNHDRGNLNGHYSQLKREDQAIRRQEQRDFHRNGGHLTWAQDKRLNREENHLQRQINRDYNR